MAALGLKVSEEVAVQVDRFDRTVDWDALPLLDRSEIFRSPDPPAWQGRPPERPRSMARR